MLVAHKMANEQKKTILKATAGLEEGYTTKDVLCAEQTKLDAVETGT